MNFYYYGKKPFVISFDSNQKNKMISKKVQLETNSYLI